MPPMRILCAIFAFIALSLPGGPAWSSPTSVDANVETARKLAHEGDYLGLVALWRNAFERGDRPTRKALIALFQGLELELERKRAQDWLLHQALIEDPSYLTDLGMAIEGGFIFYADPAKARELYQKAADRGYARAQTCLGVAFEAGRGGLQDYAKARDWYAKAAARKDPRAQRLLAFLYDRGLGGSVDADKAQALYAAAREGYGQQYDRGILFASKPLADLYYYGRGGAQDLAKARELYRVSAGIGNDDSMALLGRMMELGQGGPKDLAGALTWYLQSAELDNPIAQFYLASLYEDGRGVTQDLLQAMALYQRAVEGSGNDSTLEELHRAALDSRQRAVLAFKDSTPEPPEATYLPDMPPENHAVSNSNDEDSSNARTRSSTQEVSEPEATPYQSPDLMGWLARGQTLLAHYWIVAVGLLVLIWSLLVFASNQNRHRAKAREEAMTLRAFMQKNAPKARSQA